MSTSTATLSSASSVPAAAPSSSASRALIVGIVGLLLTAIGFVATDGKTLAMSWLVGITFWTGVSIGCLMLIMIHHIFDASWSVVLRRQYEHFVSAFPYLFVLFLPLIGAELIHPGILWKWMDTGYDMSAFGGHGTVGEDVLYTKKSGFLNFGFFTAVTSASFLIWWFLASRFRRNSFNQDSDGDIKWTHKSRKWSAIGIPLLAITLTVCAILWVKSLEYHWFSTMYGVWFFAGCVRAALSLGVILLIWRWHTGELKGILNNNHLHSIGQLMFAFTVFWAYVTFSQYFLIWNANVPEETFWYNVREMNNTDGQPNQWKWVGMFLLFGHFFAPFLTLIHYPIKLSKKWMPRVATFIAFAFLIDLCYNIMPARKMAGGDPYPFFQGGLIWTATALIGIGGIVFWAYLKSLPTTKIIPIRDPRIGECLTHHE